MTAVAIVVVIAAFIALPVPDEASDEWLVAIDGECLAAKQAIRAAAPAGGTDEKALRPYASEMVVALAGLRSSLVGTPRPEDVRLRADALQRALDATLADAGRLARAARAGDGEAITAAAEAVDASSAALEGAIAEAPLERCAALDVAPAP